MANVRNANTFYVDGTASDLEVKNIRVAYITVTSTAATASLILQDVTTTANKIRVDIASANETVELNFDENPIVFPNGIKPATVTNCVATLVLRESRG